MTSTAAMLGEYVLTRQQEIKDSAVYGVYCNGIDQGEKGWRRLGLSWSSQSIKGGWEGGRSVAVVDMRHWEV